MPLDGLTMTPEHWQQVKEVLQQALELEPEERESFLDRACSSDASLRAEIKSLLSANEQIVSSFLECRPFAGPLIGIGTQMGDYEVVSLLGLGGMGEVYRAHDRRLGRDVAIKVLPHFLSQEPDRLRRFEKEARAAAALSHPNILAVFHLGTYKESPYLVSELLQGETLRNLLRGGALSVQQAIDYGIQIARGLATAHEHGVVHRDLKPENLFVTSNQCVKILDFGLAKLTRPQEQMQADSPTLSLVTNPAALMGTPGYMAPEQVRGQLVDGRADIFALGAVLYEMLSGRRAFPGENLADVMTATLKDEPPRLSEINARVAPALERLVGCCLEKTAEQRFRSASDLAVALEAVALSPNDSTRTAFVKQPSTGWRVLACVLVIAAGLAIGLRSHMRRAPMLTEKDSIVLTDFDNRTGDSVFDDTLKQGLSVQLAQSPFLDFISDRKVVETLKLMGRDGTDRLTPEVTREVCQRTGGKAMLEGSIAALGSQYVIGLKAVNCNTGDVLAETQGRAAGKEAVLKSLDYAAISLRNKLGESLSSVQKYATPVEEATTQSLVALNAYGLGVKMNYARGMAAALPFYKRAVELDPNFAIGYVAVSVTYNGLGEPGRAAENARTAYGLRGKVSEREKLKIDSLYYIFATGEMEKAAQTLELWQQIYPRDSEPHIKLTFVHGILGNLEKSLEEAREALRLEQSDGRVYSNLGCGYACLNRLDEAEAVYKQAEERRLQTEYLLSNRYQLAFLRGEPTQMEQLVSGAIGKPGLEDFLLAAQADTEGYYGKLKKARESTRLAMDSAQRNDAKETAAEYQAMAALREVESGNREQARVDALEALKLARNSDVRAMAALVLARAGDLLRAEKLAAEIDKEFPLGTVVQRYWLPTIRAAVALERKDPNRAIELLKTTNSIELGQPIAVTVYLCPVYLRGEAYLRLHDGNAAAGEFQKFIDYRGLVANFPWGALAHLGLARAYALGADKDSATREKTRAAYRDFLTLWKDADADTPILRQAKSEFAMFR